MPINEQIGQPTLGVRYAGGDIDARNELVRRIHAEKAGSPHRYELIDPYAEVRFAYPSAQFPDIRAQPQRCTHLPKESAGDL